MVPSVKLRWLLATLLLAVLTPCSSRSTTPVPTSAVRPTSLPAATATTQPAAPPVTGGIDLSSLTGRIVFSAGPGEHQDIYVINADGSGLTQLTTDPAADFDPAWSPDGRYILFAWGDLFVMRADGTGVTRLPISGLGELTFPDWTE